MEIYAELHQNILALENIFSDCGDVVKRKISVGTGKKHLMYAVYIDNMVNRQTIENSVLRQLLSGFRVVPLEMAGFAENFFETVKNNCFASLDVKEESDFDNVIDTVISGDCVFFVDGYRKVIVLSCKEWASRGVTQSDSEVLMEGSKEAFTETLRMNTVLIRRRIRDFHLKVKQMKVGLRSKTDIALVYLDDVVRKEILTETEKRLSAIDIDAILDSGHLEQLLEENYISLFPQAQLTERPDKASAAILEGRIAVIIDNTPFVMLVPATLNTFYQSPDDYYQRWHIGSFARMMRFVSGFAATSVPGLYVALTVYHPAMIPMDLALKIAASRANVPFPAVVELMILELAFELLREAGVRLPAPMGSTIGIVGGIIIGNAVVEAGIIGPAVVVVVAITAIASFAIPSVQLIAGFRLIKYFIIFLSAIFGLYGFCIAHLFILTHLVHLKSFGIPYMSPFCSADTRQYSDLKDSILRLPSFMHERRPIFANPKQTVRMQNKQRR